jgi:hypothetical protein
VKDIDQLVVNFVKAEEKNFQLFKFVNEVSGEMEGLEREVGELEEEVGRGLRVPVTGVEEQRRREL